MLRSLSRLTASCMFKALPGRKVLLRPLQNVSKYSTSCNLLETDSTFFGMIIRKMSSTASEDKVDLFKGQGPVCSNEGEEYTLVKELRNHDFYWLNSMTNLEKEMSVDVFTKKEDKLADHVKLWGETRYHRTLILLKTILFLRFRVTAKEVMEPYLSRKVPHVIERQKGSNLVNQWQNIDRNVDYSLFLTQLLMDIEGGYLKSFFNSNHFFLVEEFFEICKFALEGDGEIFRIARPFDIHYLEEEVSCDIKFPSPMNLDFLLEEIDKLPVDETEHKCRRLVFYLGKLLLVTQ